MKDYIVSARKYRPSTFETVIGQQALVTTLKNAIANNKLAQAYLFCGPRGVGKTTCARIFAKTINCMSPTADGEACNECESCKAFNEQRSYNIHELDAASNNSVDDIRQLVEQVRIPPQIGRYKVYIIDEVHMLSAAAFNAFLKTLEEPPRHAIFILATTEKQKILPTILSRCQIYDFNRIGVEDIIEHLANVANKEGVTFEPEALNIIAQKADGGMRDALSIFDQVVSFCAGNITYKSTIENLNVLDYENYFMLTDYLLKGDVTSSLLLLNDIINKGFDAGNFINGLGSHFRDLLVSKDEATLCLLEVGASIRERYKEQSKTSPTAFLYKAMKMCSDCGISYKDSRNKRLLVECALIQLAQITGQDTSSTTAPPQQIVKKEIKPITAKPVEKKAVKAKQEQAAAAPLEMNTERQSPIFSSENKAKDKPAIKVVSASSLGISIKSKGGESKKEEAEKPSSPESDTGDTPLANEPFTFEDLDKCWREFAKKLPKEQVAIATRMQNIHLTMGSDNEVEIGVENEIAAKTFDTVITELQNFTQEKLHNHSITFKIKITETEKSGRSYSRLEQFQMMTAKNKSFMELKKGLNLELF